jgi:tetratricopeptide (TPR) repeat protein
MKSIFDIKKSISEIYALFKKRSVSTAFTLESVTNIFEIGNEVFMKNHSDEYDRLANRTPSNAPDLLDDEPFSLERTLEIYDQLESKYSEITPDLIHEVFEINSRLAWKNYRTKYDSYILDMCEKNPKDEYLCYLAAVVHYDHKDFRSALKFIDFALLNYTSSADMTHFKALCYIQLGELDTARTYLYQALFLAEISPESPPKNHENDKMYPNYPVEFHTSATKIRSDLNKLDRAESLFERNVLSILSKKE